MSYILAIESSCDDTAAAVISGRKIHSNIVSSQSTHNNFGGVVPELASREHQKNIVSVVSQALDKAKINKNDLSAVAFSNGPGLVGSLLVGSSFAKSLSLVLNIPLLAVDHLQAHVLAHYIEDANNIAPKFPFLCLLVSGGHTQILLVKDYFTMEIVGKTLDDAAGEAFDKIGKLLGLGYPAGPLLDKLAKEGDCNRFTFTHPKVEDYNYSFSGLKTAVLYFLRKELAKDEFFIENNLKDLCASIQKTIIDILMKPLVKASKDYGVKEVAIAGGVSANSLLRKEILAGDWNSYIPKFEYTTDNAAMVAMVASFLFEKNIFSSLDTKPYARQSAS